MASCSQESCDKYGVRAALLRLLEAKQQLTKVQLVAENVDPMDSELKDAIHELEMAEEIFKNTVIVAKLTAKMVDNEVIIFKLGEHINKLVLELQQAL